MFIAIGLTKPEQTPMKQIHTFYCKHVIPALSNIICDDEHANEYLPASITAFPQGKELMLILRKNGFTQIRLKRYTLGVATLYMAEKPFN